MATKHAETQTIINWCETLSKSLSRSPVGGAGKVHGELIRKVEELCEILHKAWDYCESHPENDAAFDRFQEVLTSYERGCTALIEYASRSSASGNDA